MAVGGIWAVATAAVRAATAEVSRAGRERFMGLRGVEGFSRIGAWLAFAVAGGACEGAFAMIEMALVRSSCRARSGVRSSMRARASMGASSPCTAWVRTPPTSSGE
jgi:hypothetical protein